MGVDIHDFSDLPSEIEQLGGPAARYVMVNAPEMQLSMDPANPLRAWYDLPGRNLIDYEDEEGIRMSARRISRLIDSITARGMPRQRIFLAGFSQGGSMALFTGLREELSIAGSPDTCRSPAGSLMKSARAVLPRRSSWGTVTSMKSCRFRSLSSRFRRSATQAPRFPGVIIRPSTR
jgi:hypothetical protein